MVVVADVGGVGGGDGVLYLQGREGEGPGPGGPASA